MNNRKIIVKDLLEKILRDNIVIEEVDITNEILDKFTLDPCYYMYGKDEARFIPTGRSTWTITVFDKSRNKKEMPPQE